MGACGPRLIREARSARQVPPPKRVIRTIGTGTEPPLGRWICQETQRFQRDGADQNGKILASANAGDGLFRDGQLRDYADNVTKSAPTGSVKATGKKHAAQ